MPLINRIAIVVGEESGDILGAGLIDALSKRFPECEFEGIGGTRMLEKGFKSLYPMERLAVMGFIDPLKRLPELLRIRGNLKRKYIADPPDVFIGIDAPDFNLKLEENLKRHGIPTVHYVSPSVWAWRQGRVKKIARSVDLILTLFPFEAKFFEQHEINVCFVGHPLADQISLKENKAESIKALELSQDKIYIALLPGSRKSEVTKLGDLFFEVAKRILEHAPNAHFLVPAANSNRYMQLQQIALNYSIPMSLSRGNSHEVMAASDFVLMASGTTTLEALLLKRPMVIAYKLSWFSYAILSRLVKSKYIGLPNLLAEKSLVPEFIQDEATVDNISHKIVSMMADIESLNSMKNEFQRIHESLKRDASEQAANAIAKLVESI